MSGLAAIDQPLLFVALAHECGLMECDLNVMAEHGWTTLVSASMFAPGNGVFLDSTRFQHEVEMKVFGCRHHVRASNLRDLFDRCYSIVSSDARSIGVGVSEAAFQRRPVGQHAGSGSSNSLPDLAFRSDCCGIPKTWHSAESLTFSMRNQKKFFPRPAQPPPVNIERFMAFFDSRSDVRCLFGPPSLPVDGWTRLRLDGLCSQQQEQELQQQGWEKAWHGTCLPALYSILRRGALVESHDKSRGDHFLEGFPGVYCFADALVDKVSFYCPFVEMFRDGSFWCVKLELLVDRKEKARSPPSRVTDQWIQLAHGVQLVALWVCGLTHESMNPHFRVVPWVPLAEAHPSDRVWLPKHLRDVAVVEQSSSAKRAKVTDVSEQEWGNFHQLIKNGHASQMVLEASCAAKHDVALFLREVEVLGPFPVKSCLPQHPPPPPRPLHSQRRFPSPPPRPHRSSWLRGCKCFDYVCVFVSNLFLFASG